LLNVFLVAKALRREGMQYIVAPYEADAQMAFLEKRNIVDGIITEDSDLLVFGCQNVCYIRKRYVFFSALTGWYAVPQVLFKLDSDGACVEIKRSQFAACREYNIAGWTDNEFRQ
jgi:exonuclease-1